MSTRNGTTDVLSVLRCVYDFKLSITTENNHIGMSKCKVEARFMKTSYHVFTTETGI